MTVIVAEKRHGGNIFSPVIQGPLFFPHCGGVFLYVALTGVSRELWGDWRSTLAQDCTLGTSDNSRAQCFNLQHRNRILDWLLRDPASGWLQSWLWLWARFVEVGAQAPHSAACIDLRASFVSSSPVEASPPLPVSPSASQPLPLSSSASNELKSLKRAGKALVVLQNCPCSFCLCPVKGIFARGRSDAVSPNVIA